MTSPEAAEPAGKLCEHPPHSLHPSTLQAHSAQGIAAFHSRCFLLSAHCSSPLKSVIKSATVLPAANTVLATTVFLLESRKVCQWSVLLRPLLRPCNLQSISHTAARLPVTSEGLSQAESQVTWWKKVCDLSWDTYCLLHSPLSFAQNVWHMVKKQEFMEKSKTMQLMIKREISP